MRPYLAVLSARYRMLLQYRVAAFAGFSTQVFWGFVKLMVLAAFYSVATGSQPMTFTQVVAYVWLGQAFLGMLPWNLDSDITEKMQSGAVAHDLLRPLDLYGYWFARTLALRLGTTTLRMIPLLTLVFAVLPLVGLERWAMSPPSSLASGFAFVVSLAVALLLSTAVTMIAHITLFWTISHRGVSALLGGIVGVLSGMIVPLPLFPDYLQPFFYWQPLRGLVDTPFRLYSGNIPPSAASLEITLQLAWTCVLIALGSALMRRARHALVVQGG